MSRRSLDQPLEPRRLRQNRVHEIHAVIRTQIELRVVEPACGGSDCRQRRAQIVRDGAKDGCLDGVAAP